VLFLDLDRFKAVNDTHGHAAGDTVLRTVAHRVSSVVRSPDTVARIAGDEFVVAVTVPDEADAERLADRVQHVLDTPIALGPDRANGEPLRMSASIGVATTRTRDTDPDDLVR